MTRIVATNLHMCMWWGCSATPGSDDIYCYRSAAVSCWQVPAMELRIRNINEEMLFSLALMLQKWSSLAFSMECPLYLWACTQKSCIWTNPTWYTLGRRWRWLWQKIWKSCTVPSAKTVHFPLFHSLALFSMVLWVICTGKVSKWSPTCAGQHGGGGKLSCDYHVTHLCAEQWPLKKTVRLIIFTRLWVKTWNLKHSFTLYRSTFESKNISPLRYRFCRIL